MMRITFLTVLFIGIAKCEITKANNNSKDGLEHWKANYPSFIKVIKPSTKKESALPKNEKPLFRHKKGDKTTTKGPKMPKIHRKLSKSKTKMTKMNKMHEADATTVIHLQEPKDDDYTYETLRSYGLKLQLEGLSDEIKANVTVEVIGRTKEYQDIVLLKITQANNKSKNTYFRAGDDRYADDKPEKKIIFIVHGLSVMGMKKLECLSYEPSFLQLVSFYLQHLDKFDIFLIPMANPDGYAFLQEHRGTGTWNKNASPQSECAGVALDRNFDVAWSSNHSISSCSQDYPGAMPFSEAESRAIRDIFHKYSHKIVAYLNVHAGSYHPSIFKGDAVLYPKGYTDSVTDEDKFIDMKGEIEEVIRNASFQVYSVAVDTLYNWYGKVTGSSVDYASTVYGIPFALELVMQLYSNENIPEGVENFSESVLSEVWSRVIDVIFKYIWKSISKDNEVW